MAAANDYKIERYGTPGHNQKLNQPIATATTVAGGAVALTASVNVGLKDAAGSIASTDIVWGVISQRASSVSGSANFAPNVDIETGTFFLQCTDGSITQSQAGQKVYLVGEQTVSASAALSSTAPVAGVVLAVDTTGQRYGGGYAIKMGATAPGSP